MKKFIMMTDLACANVPEGYWKSSDIMNMDLKNAQTNKKEKIFDILEGIRNNIDGMKENGLGMVLTGRNGVGKTFFSIEVLRIALLNKYSIFYINLAEFLSMVIRSYEKEEYGHYVDEIKNVDFLVVDEFGKEPKTTDHALGQIESIIKGRSSANKPNILVMNMPYEMFISRYGESIWSAVEGNNVIFDFVNKLDLRKGRGAEKWATTIR